MFGSQYYRVEKPFRIYANVGMSDSNTWVGSSRAITTVKHAWNTRPGDVLHILPGGAFLSRGKDVWEIKLKAPAPLFESKYHYVPDSRLAEDLIKSGLVAACEKPALAIDFKGLRDAVSANRMAPHQPEVVEIEPSPEAERLEELSRPFEQAILDAFPTAKIQTQDVTYDSGARRRLSFDNGHVTLTSMRRGHFTVEVSSGIEIGRDPSYTFADRRRLVRFDPPSADALLTGFLDDLAARLAPSAAPQPR